MPAAAANCHSPAEKFLPGKSPHPSVTVVLPVYRNADTLEELADRLQRVFASQPYCLEILFVIDASPDDSVAVARKLAARCPAIRVLELPHNGGQHRAVLAGFAHSRGDWLITMDADLQDQPEAVPALLAKIREGYSIVVATRNNRFQAAGRMITSRLFKALHARLTGYPSNGGMFVLLSRPVADLAIRHQGHRPYLPALLGLSAYPLASVPVTRAGRPRGESSYSRWKRLSMGLRAIAYALSLRRRLGRPTSP